MQATFTKSFEFSASYSKDGKVFGHNYILRATFQAASAADERGLSEKIDQVLIQKMHSRDFGLHVDFLKTTPADDLSRLKVFWEIIQKAAEPVRLESLCLERDRRTSWALSAG